MASDGAEWMTVEVTDDPKDDWRRAAVGRAAVRSGLLIPVRAVELGPGG